MLKITPKNYKRYLQNLARENEPKYLTHDVEKLREKVKQCIGMIDALSQIIMPFIIKQKIGDTKA